MKRLSSPILAICLTAASSHAATIVYTFDTATAAMNGSNTGQTATQAATTNTFGSGITAGTYSAVSPIGGIAVASGQMRALKKGDTDNHTFTITIPSLVGNPAGESIEFTGLSFNYGTVGGDTSPANFTVSSNRSGGTFSQTVWTHAAVVNTSAFANITLGGTFAAFSPTSVTTITFTLADSAGGNNNSTTMYTWIDNVTLTGQVIPEPRAALLGGLGLLMLLRRRRP